MEIFSRVVSWIAFAVLVIVTLGFFGFYPRDNFREASAVQIIIGWTLYLGILISVCWLASNSKIAKRLREEEDREMHEQFEAFRERWSKASGGQRRAVVKGERWGRCFCGCFADG